MGATSAGRFSPLFLDGNATGYTKDALSHGVTESASKKHVLVEYELTRPKSMKF